MDRGYTERFLVCEFGDSKQMAAAKESMPQVLAALEIKLWAGDNKNWSEMEITRRWGMGILEGRIVFLRGTTYVNIMYHYCKARALLRHQKALSS
jgi:hypothetical protein